jgi:hypothetical protein
LNQLETISGSASVTRSTPASYIAGDINGVFNVPFVAEQSKFAKCRIVARVTIPSGFDLSRWSSLNPVSFAWEVIPYSFVVDWFYDVSSYLRNLETCLLYNSRFISGYKSELFVHRSKGVASYKGNQGGEVHEIAAVSYGRTVQFQRSVLSSYPRPHAPTFKVQLGWERLLSAAALTTQLFK